MLLSVAPLRPRPGGTLEWLASSLALKGIRTSSATIKSRFRLLAILSHVATEIHPPRAQPIGRDELPLMLVSMHLHYRAVEDYICVDMLIYALPRRWMSLIASAEIRIHRTNNRSTPS